MADDEKIILVTGGSGLIGKALQSVVTASCNESSVNEKWIFVGSKEANLWQVEKLSLYNI